MKKTLLFALSAVLFTTLFSVRASAQYLPRMLEEEKGYLIDENGLKLSDDDVRFVVGDEIYNATYRGARKQFKAGNALIKGGVAGMIAGSVLSVGSLGMFMAGTMIVDPESYEVEQVDARAILGVLGVVTGLTVSTAGALALSAGIPLKTIGYKRLDWIADQYNENHGRRDVAIKLGAGKYGTGLVVTF